MLPRILWPYLLQFWQGVLRNVYCHKTVINFVYKSRSPRKTSWISITIKLLLEIKFSLNLWHLHQPSGCFWFGFLFFDYDHIIKLMLPCKRLYLLHQGVLILEAKSLWIDYTVLCTLISLIMRNNRFWKINNLTKLYAQFICSFINTKF